jgi:hypothetical protein
VNHTLIYFFSKNTAQSEGADFLGNSFGVGTVARAEGDTTTNEDRSLPIPVTGTTGAFLAIHLLASSADLSPGFGLGCSGTPVGLVCNNKVVHGLSALGTISDELNLGLFGVLNGEC